MNSHNRRTMILESLSLHKKISVDELVAKFDVSKRTILRDISALSLEYPIYTITGPNGGLFIDKDWKSKKKYLNSEQIQILQKYISSNRTSNIDKEILISIINDFSAP